jgi:hypothetical protein
MVNHFDELDQRKGRFGDDFVLGDEGGDVQD